MLTEGQRQPLRYGEVHGGEDAEQGLIDIDQTGAFGEIEITWLGDDAHHADLAAIDVYDG